MSGPAMGGRGAEGADAPDEAAIRRIFASLEQGWEAGFLDAVRPDVRWEVLGSHPLQWVGSATQLAGLPVESGKPVPLVAMEGTCLMRSIATEALDRAGIPWRLVLTSQSLSGVWAGVAAGLGVTVRTRVGLTAQLQALDPAAYGLPSLPSLGLALHRAEPAATAACQRLREIIAAGVAELGEPSR